MENRKKIFSTLGASNHTDKERQTEDFYATDPRAVELLLQQEKFSPKIWECACGQGHISKVLEAHGYQVRSTDLIDRGYGERMDFLYLNSESWDGDIITNPPYSLATEFVYQALDCVNNGQKVAMFLRLLFLEGQARRMLFEVFPPKVVYVFSSRMLCAQNGDFQKENYRSAVAFAWFVWEKGYVGQTIIKWI